MATTYEVIRGLGNPIFVASTHHDPPFVTRMQIFAPAWIPAHVREEVIAHIIIVLAAAADDDLAYQVRERAREQAE